MHGSDRKLEVLFVMKLREYFILIALVKSYGT